MICLRLCREAIVNPIHSGYGDDTNEIVIGVNDGADRRIKPLLLLGFRLVTKVSLISNFRSSRDLHLFSIAVGASQSAANDWKACLNFGAFLFGERYATRSTNNSFSNEAENDH